MNIIRHLSREFTPFTLFTGKNRSQLLIHSHPTRLQKVIIVVSTQTIYLAITHVLSICELGTVLNVDVSFMNQTDTFPIITFEVHPIAVTHFKQRYQNSNRVILFPK